MEGTFTKHYKRSREIWGRRKTGSVRTANETSHHRKGLRKFSAAWLLSALLALLLIFPLSATANSPSDVQLIYLDKEQTLQVKIAHKSFVPASHYIAKVEIQKNSEKPLIYEYKSQSDKETFTYVYKLSLKKGDRVDVNVVCNLFGSRSSSLIYAGPKN